MKTPKSSDMNPHVTHALERLKELAQSGGSGRWNLAEKTHREAEDILIELLANLGYPEIGPAFRNINEEVGWYYT